jgi:hypothetical protein
VAQADGLEEQYQYKAGKKKFIGLPRLPKRRDMNGYPGASKAQSMGKNPVSECWNSEEHLIWQEKWADVTNKYLVRYPCARAKRHHLRPL